MKKEYLLTIKAMVYGQLFVDTLDQLRGTNHFKQQLKNKGNSFHKEAEKFLNIAYGGGATDNTILELLEHLEVVIEKEVGDKVVFEE
jgi:hypothetical protein